MKRHIIFSILVCGLLSLISLQVLAQSDNSQEEALRLSNLCLELKNIGKYDEALEPCQRALAIDEKMLGGEHPDVAISLNNLAALYNAKGEYPKAEPLYLRSLAILEKMLGSEHPSVATSLNNLAGLYSSKGEHAKAEPLFLRSLAIREKALGGDHPHVATSLNNLAGLYDKKGEHAKAEPLYLRALAILEKALGPEHPAFAASLNNLATLYSAKGEYAKAEPLYLRALVIDEKELGSEHPAVADSLNNLAALYNSKGEYAKAETLYLRSLAIREKALGGDHPYVADSLNNLAGLYGAKEDYTRAVELKTRGQEILESNLSAILTTGSEQQKQLYLDMLSGETDSSVSLHAHSAPANLEAARLALTTILRRKGRALDAMTDQIAGLRRRASADDVRLLDALAAAQSKLANLQLSGDMSLSPNESRTRITALETEIEKLQGDISRRSAEFRVRTQPVTLDAVRKAIPTDAALVEIYAYQPYDANAKSIYERFGKARYVAYVLKPQSDTPQFVDLGDAVEIDADLKLWREALLNENRTDVRQLGRRVDERIMRPVRKLLGSTRRLFISPDGALNLVPFAALVDESNRYLLETYALNYLTSGRDLLRLQVSSNNRPGAVIFANPTYNLTSQPVAACRLPKLQRGLLLGTQDADTLKEGSAAAKRDITYRSVDFTNICYEQLTGTAEEAVRINAALTRSRVLTGKHATEAALKALNSPPILHVATHGFFLPDQPQTTKADGAQSAGASSTENPLLRSGLIMAGANQKSSGAGEDGVLTAAETAGLNLWGTKLVVLSACETGLGDVVNGAGVYGLRRALVLAGSETQVMSLWQVDDVATRDLMSDYYARLQRGEGRAEAMRQTQLGMLRGKTQTRVKGTRTRRQTAADIPGQAHPFYWAAFISSGDWRSMNGKGL